RLLGGVAQQQREVARAVGEGVRHDLHAVHPAGVDAAGLGAGARQLEHGEAAVLVGTLGLAAIGADLDRAGHRDAALVALVLAGGHAGVAVERLAILRQHGEDLAADVASGDVGVRLGDHAVDVFADLLVVHVRFGQGEDFGVAGAHGGQGGAGGSLDVGGVGG